MKTQQSWFLWYYHAEAQLLLICPQDFMQTQANLWHRIFEVCCLPAWPSFQTEAHARMLLREEGLGLLLKQFNPKFIWLIACPKNLVQSLKHPFILETQAKDLNAKAKKEIWLKWMESRHVQVTVS